MNSKYKTIIAILITLIIVIIGLLIWWNQEEIVTTSEATNMFNLRPPINIDEIIYYRDGGTIGVVLKDSSSQTFMFCLDGRIQIQDPGVEIEPHHVYIGATHPGHQGAEQLSLYGEKEKAILEILQNWVAENMTEQEISKLSNPDTFIGFSDEEIKLYRILNLVEKLEKRLL